jgi:thymidylate kinase
MYGHYPYARNSKLIKYLIKLFPKPDFVFLLDVDIETLIERRKDQTEQNLREQYENYMGLVNLVRTIKVKSKGNIDKNLYKLIEVIWKRVFKKLKY